MAAVAEGYPTARSTWALARKHAVVTRIDETYAMLYQRTSKNQMVHLKISIQGLGW